MREWLKNRYIENEDYIPIIGNIWRCFRASGEYSSYGEYKEVFYDKKYWQGTGFLIGYNAILVGIGIGGHYLTKALI